MEEGSRAEVSRNSVDLLAPSVQKDDRRESDDAVLFDGRRIFLGIDFDEDRFFGKIDDLGIYEGRLIQSRAPFSGRAGKIDDDRSV